MSEHCLHDCGTCKEDPEKLTRQADQSGQGYQAVAEALTITARRLDIDPAAFAAYLSNVAAIMIMQLLDEGETNE